MPPDLMIVDVAMCASNKEWQTRVKGQTDTYDVKFGRVEIGPVIYDYTCSCPHFQYRLVGTGTHCKHIKHVIEQKLRCGWNEQLDPGLHAELPDWCPNCGGSLVHERVGV
mgnify:FL=1